MEYCISTFKESILNKSNDNNTAIVMNDLRFQISTLNPKSIFSNDCVEYANFLDEMQVLINKVDSDDLCDFEEF